MSWYSEYKNEWKEIINTVSSEIKRDSVMVEKDTIQSIFLFELSKYDFPFVFKGGTSLSKAFSLIDRFSEDIDLSLSKKPTDSDKRRAKDIILEVSEKLGLYLDNPNNIKSRYDYNKYVFKYESLFSLNEMEIIVETSFYQEVYPIIKHKISSFIGNFCYTNNINLPIPFDAGNFEINVQSLERTFIDKVFAICDYRIENMWERDSRHLYDIAKIIPHINLDDLKELIVRVRKDRMNSKNNPSANLKHDINNILNDIIVNRFFESDYNGLTKKLLYEKFSYDRAIDEGIKIVLNKKIF